MSPVARNEVKVKITGDASKLGGALAEAEGQLAGFQGRTEALGSKMRSVGQTMTLGVTLPIAAAGTVAVKWAGELEDASAMTAQVFGDSARYMGKWAEHAADMFGLSTGDALETANQFGIRLRQIGGLSTTEASKVSRNLTQLAGDFASAFGGTVQDAALALQSALTGEFEPLKRYGIVINDAALKNKLFQMTGEDVKGTLTAQQKQMATLALITEQSAIVQGDYARNADGATNAQRTMTAQLKDAATTLGTIMLPYVTKAVQFITDLVKKFKELSPTAQKVIVVVAAVAAALGPIIYIAGAVATAIGFIASPIGLVVAAIAALVAGLVALYRGNEEFRTWVNDIAVLVKDKLAAGFHEIVGGIQAFAAAWTKNDGDVTSSGFPGFMEKLAHVLRSVADEVLPALGAAFQWFKDTALPALEDAFQRISTEVMPIVQDAFTWLTETGIPAAVEGFQWFQDEVLPVLTEVGGFLAVVFGVIVDGMVAAVENFRSAASAIAEVMNWLWPIIEVVWTYIVESISAAMTIIQGVIATVTALISGDWSGVWEGIKQIAAGVWAGIVALIAGAIGIAQVILSGALSAISSLWSSVWNGVRSTVSSVFSTVTGVISGAMNSASSTVSSVLSSIGAMFGGVRGMITGALSGIADVVAEPFRAAGDAIKTAWNNTIGGRGISIPKLDLGPLGSIGGGSWSVPRLHTGGTVPGRVGTEALYILQAGETVRTKGQEAGVQAALDRADAVQPAAAGDYRPAGVVVHIDARGSLMTDDMPRQLVSALEQFFADGGRSPRLAQAVAG